MERTPARQVLGVLLFVVVVSVFELLRPRCNFTIKHSPRNARGVLQFPRSAFTLLLLFLRLSSLSFSLSLYISRAFCLLFSGNAHQAADANHSARGYLCIPDTIRTPRVAHPLPPSPTRCTRGALTSPTATRKSGRNTLPMRSRVFLSPSFLRTNLGGKTHSVIQDVSRRISRNPFPLLEKLTMPRQCDDDSYTRSGCNERNAMLYNTAERIAKTNRVCGISGGGFPRVSRFSLLFN